jgi:dihydropteroate synthase
MSFVYKFGSRTYDLSARTHIMGVLNVTPDSFSDGGKFLDPERAVDYALHMVDEGADIIDIGGESTRPKSAAYQEGADAVSAAEELRRVIPVISALARQSDIPISIDTYKAEVAAAALDAGACIVNDISGFRFDPAMPATVAQRSASAILMHIKGTPKTMQVNPAYEDLIGEVRASLRASVSAAANAGIRQIMIDPGIGFGKTREHNLQLLRNLARFASFGYPVVVGVSRKSFLGELLNLPIAERLEGSLAAAAAAVLYGAHMIRVHDVRQSKRAMMVVDAIKSASTLAELAH